MPKVDDPVLIQATIEGIQSLIAELGQGLDQELPKIEDPQTRRVLVSLKSEVDLINTLLQTALIPYLTELDRRALEEG